MTFLFNYNIYFIISTIFSKPKKKQIKCLQLYLINLQFFFIIIIKGIVLAKLVHWIIIVNFRIKYPKVSPIKNTKCLYQKGNKFTLLDCTFPVLYFTLQYFSLLYIMLVSFSLPYCTSLCFSVLYCILLYSTAFHSTLLYFPVLYCSALYYTVLYCRALYWLS